MKEKAVAVKHGGSWNVECGLWNVGRATIYVTSSLETQMGCRLVHAFHGGDERL